MALTMTRTRTQTTLTKLAELVANVHGELAFLEGLLVRGNDGVGCKGPRTCSNEALAPEVRVRLAARQLKLTADRDALYATVRQFDSSIDPERIGALDGWKRRFGTKGLRAERLAQRYLAS